MDELITKKILIVGDSLCAAYKMPKEHGWVHLMQGEIDKAKQDYHVVNASVSGATTAAGLAIMKGALGAHQPDIIVLALGANDGLQGKPVSYITKNLETLIAQATATEAQVLLVGIRLPPNFGSRYTKPFFEQYGTLAAKYNLPLVPFLLEGVAGDPELMMSDGLHPNKHAQEKVLANVWSILKPLL